MLSLARKRLPEVTFVHGDAFDLPFPDGDYDFVFTSHFYGHLRADDRGRFLREVRRVAPQLVVVDSALRPGEPLAEENAVRTLSDGSVHLVYKRRFEPDRLAAGLEVRGPLRRRVVRRDRGVTPALPLQVARLAPG